MFEAAGYKIKFHRVTTMVVIPGINKDENGTERAVERDITLCIIGILERQNYHSYCSIKHPADVYNKIIGKKIALTGAIRQWNLPKEVRTIIWKTFWKWVESWNPQNRMFYHMQQQQKELAEGIERFSNEEKTDQEKR